MVSREEFIKFVKELMEKDKDNENLKYMKRGYNSLSVVFIIITIFAFIGGMPLLFILGSPLGAFLEIIAIFFGFLGGYRFYKWHYSHKYYKENYRAKILEYLLSNCDYSFDEEGQISEKIFEDSQFGGYYEKYCGLDKLTINIPNDDNSKSQNYLTLCDLEVTKTVEDSDGDEREVTVYEGVFGYVEFPFEFKCLLCINSSYKKSGVKIEKVHLEDINFNRKFKVYCNDQIESRYILTPDFMSRLIDFNKKAGYMKLTLVGNKMYIGFPNKNLFELKDIDDEKFESMFSNIYDELSMVLELVNEIKSNNKVFKV